MKRKGILAPGQPPVLNRDTGSIDETGLATRTQVYTVNTVDLFSNLPAAKSAFPGRPNIRLRNITWRSLDAELTQYTLTYRGFNGNAQQALAQPPVYRLGIIDREESIANHPNRAEIAAAVGEENLVFDEDGIFIAIGRDSNVAELVGVSDYLDFGLTWEEIKWEQNAPNLSNTNTIFETSDLPGGASRPSGVPAGRNWLFKGAPYDDPANDLFRVRRSWILSGRNGISPLIYPNP